MRKRHANEFIRTGFANSGRIAGMGIAHDDYSEDSGCPTYGPGSMLVRLPYVPHEESPIISYKLTEEELKRYK